MAPVEDVAEGGIGDAGMDTCARPGEVPLFTLVMKPLGWGGRR